MPGINETGAPDTRDLIVGRGRLLAARLTSAGLPDANGYLHLGNAPEFNLTVNVEDLRHTSSLDALGFTDKRVVISREVEIGFVLEEGNHQNYALLFAGNVESFANTQALWVDPSDAIISQAVLLGRWYELYDDDGERVYDLARGSNEVFVLTADATTASDGTYTLTVNGQTTAAIDHDAAAAAIISALELLSTVGSGDVAVVDGGGGLASNNGTATITFQGALAAQAVTLTANFGSLVGNAHVLSNPTDGSTGLQFTVSEDPAGTPVPLTMGTDYEIDAELGHIRFLPTAVDIADGDTVGWTIDATPTETQTIDTVQGLTESDPSFSLIFVEIDPANGGQKAEWLFHKVSLSADGEVGLISNEWRALPFTGLAESNSAITSGSKVLQVRTFDQAA
jgi:hypothetical protein